MTFSMGLLSHSVGPLYILSAALALYTATQLSGTLCRVCTWSHLKHKNQWIELFRQTRNSLFLGGPPDPSAVMSFPAWQGQTGHEERGRLDVAKETVRNGDRAVVPSFCGRIVCVLDCVCIEGSLQHLSFLYFFCGFTCSSQHVRSPWCHFLPPSQSVILKQVYSL